MEKKCRKCKDPKSLKEFPKAYSTIDGKDSICKSCYRKLYKDKKPSDDYKDNFFTHDKYYK